MHRQPILSRILMVVLGNIVLCGLNGCAILAPPPTEKLPPPPQPPASKAQLKSEPPLAQDRNGYQALNIETLGQTVNLRGGDPEVIAREAFGTTEPIEGAFQEEVTVNTLAKQWAVVTITQQELADDSVQSLRYRIEFEPIADAEMPQWQATWVGQQQICQPGRGAQTWSPEQCS